MVQTKWLVVNTGRQEDVNKIAEAAEKCGREVKKASLKDVYEGTNLWEPGDHVVLHGPIMATEFLTETYGWLSWINLRETECLAYYPRFGDMLVQNPYSMVPLGDLRRLWDHLEEQHGEDGLLFVRPNANDKAFTAKVIEKRDCIYFDRAGQDPSMLVVVSRPLNILNEWRLFFHNETYLTGSLYKTEGTLHKEAHVPQSVLSFARKLSGRRYPGLPPVWVMDVAQLDDRLAVLEVSGTCCAGFYEADHEKIVSAISQEADLAYDKKAVPA